ncbi:hypothetical protein EGT07_18860 [Herbaspirillum sp. HC18]|nr:hypothetical protein EGT07_18860 [Herbaspirillum sp. HC18]
MLNLHFAIYNKLAIMAIWQFTVELIPANWIGGRPTITEDEHNEAEWWGSQQPPSGFEEHLQKLLPEAKSWNSDLRQWGAQKSDLIEVWYEDGAVESISVRFDCRNINPALLRGIFELSEDLNCRLVYKRDLAVIGNSLESLIEKLWNSPNHKFLEAPQEWLPKMAKEISDRESNR